MIATNLVKLDENESQQIIVNIPAVSSINLTFASCAPFFYPLEFILTSLSRCPNCTIGFCSQEVVGHSPQLVL
jgi:hypothetical protein